MIAESAARALREYADAMLGDPLGRVVELVIDTEGGEGPEAETCETQAAEAL